LTNIQIDPKVKESVSEKVAKHYHVFPIAVEEGLITLAIADPFNVQLTDDLKILLDTNIKVVIAKEEQIEGAIKKAYSIKVN